MDEMRLGCKLYVDARVQNEAEARFDNVPVCNQSPNQGRETGESSRTEQNSIEQYRVSGRTSWKSVSAKGFKGAQVVSGGNSDSHYHRTKANTTTNSQVIKSSTLG